MVTPAPVTPLATDRPNRIGCVPFSAQHLYQELGPQSRFRMAVVLRIAGVRNPIEVSFGFRSNLPRPFIKFPEHAALIEALGTRQCPGTQQVHHRHVNGREVLTAHRQQRIMGTHCCTRPRRLRFSRWRQDSHCCSRNPTTKYRRECTVHECRSSPSIPADESLLRIMISQIPHSADPSVLSCLPVSPSINDCPLLGQLAASPFRRRSSRPLWCVKNELRPPRFDAR